MKLLYTLAVCLLFSGCGLIDPEEDRPAFLEVNSFGFELAPNQGTGSTNISELWCSINDNIIGSFDLPASIPVLSSQATSIRLQAGIKNNGVGATRIRYPFYQPYDTTIYLTSGQIYEVNPVFRYFDNLNIDASRNFESMNFLAGYGSNQGTSETTSNSNLVFEGNKSGLISLTGTQEYFLFRDVNPIVLDAGNTIFLEMNYSTNNTFTFGSYVTTSGVARKTPIITITPTTSDATIPKWNKIYIDLGALALGNPNALDHQFYLEGAKSEASSPRIYLDNLKIVRWP